MPASAVSEKKCRRCGEVKARSEFSPEKRNLDGLYPYCKECVRKKNKAYYAKNSDRILEHKRIIRHSNPELHNARSREWRANNGGKLKVILRRSQLKRKFGITPEQYESMLLAQDGVCAICRQPDDRRDLSVDHCHTSGRIRGLLCSDCNLAIGKFSDNPVILREAALYLERGGFQN